MNKILKNRSRGSQSRAAKTLAKKKFEKCKKIEKSHESPISKGLKDKGVSSATACLNVYQGKKEELRICLDTLFVNNFPRQEEDYMMFSSDDETLLDTCISAEDSFTDKIEYESPIRKSNILKISTDYHEKSGTGKYVDIAKAKLNQNKSDTLAPKSPENAKCGDTPDISSILDNAESPIKGSNHVKVLADSQKTKRRGRHLKDIVKTNVSHTKNLNVQQQLMKNSKFSGTPSYSLAPENAKYDDTPNFSSILDAVGESDRFKVLPDSPRKKGTGRRALKDIVKTNVSHTKCFNVQQQLMNTSKLADTPSHSLAPKSAKSGESLNPFSVFDTVKESNRLKVSPDSSKIKGRGRRTLKEVVKIDVGHTKSLSVEQQPMKSSKLSDTPCASLTSNAVRRPLTRLNNLKISTDSLKIKTREKYATKCNQTKSRSFRKESTKNSKLDISSVSPILDIVENLDSLKTPSDTHQQKEIGGSAAKRIAKTRTSQTQKRSVEQDSKKVAKPSHAPDPLCALGDTQTFVRETRSRNPYVQVVFSSFGMTPSKVISYKRLSNCIPVSISAVNTSKQVNSNASCRTNKEVKMKKSVMPSLQTTCRVSPRKRRNISTNPSKSEIKAVKKSTIKEKSDLLLKSFSNESISSTKKLPSCNKATPRFSSVETKQQKTTSRKTAEKEQKTTYDSTSSVLLQSNGLSPLMISHMSSARVLVKPILKPFQSPLVCTLSPSSSSSVSEPSIAVGCVSDNDDFEDFGFLGCTPLPPVYCGSVKSKPEEEVDISCWNDVSQNVTWQPKSAKELLRKEAERKKVENELIVFAKRKELNQKVETNKVKRIKLNKVRKTIAKSKEFNSKISKKEKGKIVKQNPKIGSNSEKATSKTSKKALKQESTSSKAENPKPTRNKKTNRSATTQKKNRKKPEPEIGKENLKKPKKGKAKQDYMRCLLDVVKNRTFDDNDAFCDMDANLWRFGNGVTSGDMAYASESEVSGLSYLSSATPPLQHSLMDLSRHSLEKKIVPDALLADSKQIQKGTNQFGNPNKTANMKKKLEDLSLSESLVKKKKIKLLSKSSSCSPVNIPNFEYNFMDDDSSDDDSDGLASVSSGNVLNVPYLNEVKLAEKKPKEFVKLSLATKHKDSKL